MNIIHLRKYALWAISCVGLVLFFVRQGNLSNSLYNREVKKQSYSVKVIDIKKEREYYINGIDRQGRYIKLIISPKWNLSKIRVGDSIIKKADSYEIRVITGYKTNILFPGLPL